MHNENGPPVSLGSAWEFDGPDLAGIKLGMSIAGPELVDVRHTVCTLILPVTEFIDEELALEVEQQLGSLLTNRRTNEGTNVRYQWHFAREQSVGNCGRAILLARNLSSAGKFHTLDFLDLAYPKDGNWDRLSDAMTKCRS